jgi:SAM-dependent methyltransferase
VNSTTAAQLLDLNRQFYQTFAQDFAATRRRIQPGMRRILDGIPLDAHLLDLGCGSGGLALELVHRGFRGSYTGLDFSTPLLEAARASLAQAGPLHGRYAFHTADLSQTGWSFPLRGKPVDVILAFAVLHHLPGETLRRRMLAEARALFDPGRPSGHILVLSVWQFMNSARLAARVVPWEQAGISPDQVDAGDNLLDWRAGGMGLRYVHLFSQEELEQLAQACGYEVDEGGFYSDGKEGNLGLYQIWSPLFSASG